MSLINQMLKDIDKRQGNTQAGASLTAGMAATAARERSGLSGKTWMVAGGGLLLLAVAGMYLYGPGMRPGPAATADKAVAVTPAAPPAAPVVAAAEPVVAAPLASAPVVTPAPATAAASVPVASAVAQVATPPVAPAAPAPRQADVAASTKVPALPASRAPAAQVAQPEPSAEAPKASKKALAEVPAVPTESKTARRTEAPAVGQISRVLSAEQRADNAYREASSLLRQGRSLDAQKALQQALTDLPAHQEARLLYAQVLQGEGRVADARALLQTGMNLQPQAFALNAALAQMQLLGREADQAIATLERGLSAAGDNAAYHALLATALQQQARHADAVQQYVIALRQQPDSPNWLVGLGVSLQAQGQSQGAAEAYQRALDLGLPASLSQFARERLQQVSR